MKPGLTFLPAIAAAMLALPLAAFADTRPDFDEDAKPILKMQPELLHFVKTNFEVKETGYSKTPGDDDHRPPPPYIFRARRRGTEGPYNVTLLIQPGPPGHILFVKDPNMPPALAQQHSPYAPPAAAPQPAPPQESAPANEQPTPANTPAASSTPQEMPPAPTTGSSSSSEPTSATPSGPIPLNSGASLAPPPDPAPGQ
jgi:hypothetical protein